MGFLDRLQEALARGFLAVLSDYGFLSIALQVQIFSFISLEHHERTFFLLYICCPNLVRPTKMLTLSWITGTSWHSLSQPFETVVIPQGSSTDLVWSISTPDDVLIVIPRGDYEQNEERNPGILVLSGRMAMGGVGIILDLLFCPGLMLKNGVELGRWGEANDKKDETSIICSE